MSRPELEKNWPIVSQTITDLLKIIEARNLTGSECIMTREVISELLSNLLPNFNQSYFRQIKDTRIHSEFKTLFMELQDQVTAHRRCNMQTLANLSIINMSYLKTLDAK